MSLVVKISGDLLYNVKLNLPYDEEIKKLKILDFKDLILGLENDHQKKTFWINIYNAFYQILALEIDDKSIFKIKKIEIAECNFSLDGIEYGILRKGKFILGFGFLYNPFYSKIIKKMQVDHLDFRIHFALNCGAVSCPPILIYEMAKIENQLQLATNSFITSETTINIDTRIIKTSKLLFWYQKDFRSKAAIKALIGSVFLKDFSNYNLKYNNYSWIKKLQNFSQ